MTLDLGTIVNQTNGPAGPPAEGLRVYEIEGFLFRFDPARPQAAASAWRDGRWEPIPLTGDDICHLVQPHMLTPEELEAWIAGTSAEPAA